MNEIEKERYEDTLEQNDTYYVSILPDLEQELKDMQEEIAEEKPHNYIMYNGMMCMAMTMFAEK